VDTRAYPTSIGAPSKPVSSYGTAVSDSLLPRRRMA
jgi:hypothetical protein